MKFLVDSYNATGSLHHAYLIEGDRENIRSLLLNFIERDLKIPIRGNPDVWHRIFDTFTIDEARNLREIQSNKALSDTKKIFILELTSITVEAQNSLLKVFEEPTPSTHFFIIAPTAELFLPTVKSRVMIIPTHFDAYAPEESKTFVSLSVGERIKYVESIIEAKDKTRAIGLIDGILKTIHHDKPDPFVIQELLKCKMFLNDRSPSYKLLLEHISLIL